MPSHGRRRRDSCSDDDDAASMSGRNHLSTTTAAGADSQGQQQVEVSHPVPGLSLNSCKSGSGWAVGPFQAYFLSHDDQGRARSSVFQPGADERGSSGATPEVSVAANSRCSLPGPSGAREEVLLVSEEEEVPAKDCYFPPSQDNGEDDKDTFVDKGSAAALDVPANTTAVSGIAAVHAGSSPSGAPVVTTSFGAALSSTKRTSKVRPAVTVHGPPSSIVVNSSGPSTASTNLGGFSGARMSGNNNNNIVYTNNTLGTAAGAPCSAFTGGGFSSTILTVNAMNTTTTAATTTSNVPANAYAGAVAAPSAGNGITKDGTSIVSSPATAGASNSNTPWQVTRLSATANLSPTPHVNTPLLRRTTAGKSGTNTFSAAPQYSRLNSSEAAPGVIYRATLAVRAMAMDPEQPVLWAAVGDDPLAALRVDGGEITHSKSVKDIEQVHCMAVVRIAEDDGTTFKSASASPRGGLSTPKLATQKAGRRSKKSGRRSASTRKSGKFSVTAGSPTRVRSASTPNGDDDDGGGGNVSGSEECDSRVACSPVGRENVRFSNYLWCGLSRGHMAVVNMTTLEYQVIHNAHTQTVNRVWYWEARNKVWSAGREKGVHVWDPQRRVILKKRNIAAILTDATYAEAVDKVFAVADDPCVRVFEPGGENVNVPKGQENRIKMKSDASVVQYHSNSGLVWVGLARGSVLMNSLTMDVERTLPFTFSAILFEGDHAIIAGQEGQNCESRLMVLDVTNPRDPSVLAYTKFMNPLPFGIHIIPHTRFAVAAQDDPKKGVVVVIFVYAGTVALTHTVTTAGKYPEQRTEKVVRGPTIGASPSSFAQTSPQPLAIAALNSDAAGSTVTSAAISPPPPIENGNTFSGHNNIHTNNNSGVVVTADRQSLYRATVVKYSPDTRTDRKFNVEADHTTLVEAIGPEAQEIKSALKHLVKTTDEMRQSLVQQRSAEATLADFSRLLRGRQQWLIEQGSIANLPVLTPPVAELINRDYVTPEGKTIAMAIEQLQQMYTKTQVKLQEQKQLLQQQQQQQRQSPNSAQLSVTSPIAPSRLLPSLSSPFGVGCANAGTAEANGQNCTSDIDERRAPLFLDDNSTSTAHTTVPGYTVGSTSGNSNNVKDTVSVLWASQLAATLQRERVLHEQQLGALQLKVERLTERNAALSNAFARLQAHVAALGLQSLSVLEVDSTDSTTMNNSEEIRPAALRQGDPQRHLLSVLSTQQEAAVAFFNQLSRGKYHKPKYARHATEVLMKGIDEVVRLTQVKASRSREADALGGTVVMRHSSSTVLGNAAGEDQSGSVEPRHSIIQTPRYQTSSSSPSLIFPSANYQQQQQPSPPQRTPHDFSTSAARAALGASSVARSLSGHLPTQPAVIDPSKSILFDRPITSLRGACSMVEAELNNLHTLNVEATSFWARLLNTHQQGNGGNNSSTNVTAVTTSPGTSATAAALRQDDVTESGLKSIDSELQFSLSSSETGASPTLLHLMASRVLQTMCWAECEQTVLRELTNTSGLENPFVAGGVHNALVSAHTIGTGLNGPAGDSQEEWWRQGPLEVLDYESAQERAEVLHTVNRLSTSSVMELSNTSHIREALQMRCRASKEYHGAHKDNAFMLHRLPGALCWSQTALRLLFTFLESTESVLTAAVIALNNEEPNMGEKTHTPQKAQSGASPHDVVTRTASAVGVAMTHWSLFLLNLRAELLAVHHATRLYHAWCWGLAVPQSGVLGSSNTSTAKSSRITPQSGRKNATEAAEGADATAPLADVASSLTAKGKLLLLYMQWCFPAFGGNANINGGGCEGAGFTTASSASAPSVSGATATVNVPPFFTAELENDAASTVAVRRSPAECGAMLAEVVALTAQLLRRVVLLLSYCHAIRARSLAALEGSSDAAVARLVSFMGSSGSAEVDARVPTEQEKAFLKSEGKSVV